MLEVLEGKQGWKSNSITQGWQTRKLGHRKLQETIEILRAIQNTQELTRKFKNICYLVMSKEKRGNGNMAVYWWNQVISQLTVESLRKR